MAALFTLRDASNRRFNDEVFRTGLKPLALDAGDIVSLAVQHERCGVVGVAAAGAACDADGVGGRFHTDLFFQC